MEDPELAPADNALSDDSAGTLLEESDQGLEILGRGVKVLVEAVRNLRRLGVEDLVLPLPKICVVGDQSTGKSSLIEGISGIKVPRNIGTCTRCPLEINLSESAQDQPWKCEILLQKRYIYQGSLGGEQRPTARHAAGVFRHEGATRSRPLGSWCLQDTEEFPFFSTSVKDAVPQALHLAQLATLNPGMSHEKFIPGKGDYSTKKQVKFSPNIVRVNITAPNVPNLSFYDLPGVINQAEVPEEEYLVDLVQNLVKEYIKTDNCLNLLALPMTDDPANSTAAKLIRSVNAEARTIGVLTKPDRVQCGESLEQWIDILNGKRFKLGFGYHVVKNNPDPGVDHTTARREESEFFDQNEPWAQELKAHNNHFGTFKLQATLSRKLTAQIHASLPRITEQVGQKLAEIAAKLKELPEPPQGNLPLKIFEKLLQFDNEIQQNMAGGSREYPFQKDWHSPAIHFRQTMAYSYPRLSLSTSSSISTTSRLPHRQSTTPSPSNQTNPVTINIDSDNENPASKGTPTTPSKRKNKTTDSSPLKRSRINDIPQFIPEKSIDISEDTSIDQRAPYAKRFTLRGIRCTLQDVHIGLPNQVDPRAIEKMIRESLSTWDKPLHDLLHSTGELCRQLLFERIETNFGLWQQTRFFETVQEICGSWLDSMLAMLNDIAERILNVERYKALTYNHDAMQTACDNALTALQNARQYERAKAKLNSTEPDWEAKLNEKAQKERIKKVSDQLEPDPYIQEVRAMADVRGYYDCAYSRFVDVVCQNIHVELFARFRDDLPGVMREKIGLNKPQAPEICAVLLAIDPHIEEKRLQLSKEKETLEKAQEWLETIAIEEE
ncbi:MAG: hypothetical protein LQ342_004024 [Letrouitia transgressa]|nr:MAG: hypothetical protein LQ342_004024 [Letrouitia transgressa]